MSKKSIAQTMKDAGFKPPSRAQQQQNIAILTPVWIEEQNDMTTKTDAARECAEEIAQHFDSWVSPDVILEIVSKHFPPSVPVSKLKTLEPFTTRFIAEQYDRFHLGAQNGWVRLSDIEALIAEAK